MKITQQVNIRLSNFFGTNGDQIQENARALIFRAIFLGLESHSEAHQQLQILKASQGQEYKPFISGEVNRAVANLVSSNKPIQEIIKLMIPSTGITINNLNSNTDKSSVNYITPDMAVTMIRDKSKSMIEDTTQLEALPVSHPELPDISARTQDLTKIGIKNEAFKVDKKGPNEPIKGSKIRPKNDKDKASFEHGERASIEILDEDSDDFRI